MANIFPIESLGIFILFYATYKFKFQKFIISLLFNNQVVYLPLTDNDFKQLMDLAKENKLNKKQDKVLIRSCEFKEYSEKTKSRKYLDLDFLVFIYFCNFSVYSFNFIYKLFRLIILGKEKSPFLLTEEKNNETKESNESSNIELNFSIYLSLSFIIYIIFRELTKSVFANGFFGRAAKEFYLYFILCYSIFFANEYYNEKLFNLNYESAIKITSNRIEAILTQAKANIDININKFHIKIFFSILFALMASIFLRCSERGAYFDNFFCNISKTSELNLTNLSTVTSYNSENPNSNNNVKLEYISKIKSILNIIMMTIILNPLLDNFLEVININSGLKKLIIIFILLNIDFICGFFILWYAYFMFSVQNYQEIMKFVKNPNPQFLIYHQRGVDYINENAWDVLSHVFMNCFVPFYIFICYLNEINIFDIFFKDGNKNKSEIDFNNGFVDNFLEIVFLGMIFSKGIVQNLIFYYRLMVKEKHLTLF